MVPSNGLPFSCRKRATMKVSKANDRARAAVGCTAGLDGMHGRGVFMPEIALLWTAHYRSRECKYLHVAKALYRLPDARFGHIEQ
jgi:hypothetical protein